jgi:hypothetical protein
MSKLAHQKRGRPRARPTPRRTARWMAAEIDTRRRLARWETSVRPMAANGPVRLDEVAAPRH